MGSENNERDALVKKIESECASHAIGGFSLSTAPINPLEGAKMKHCLEAGGLENYKDNLVRAYEEGHGLNTRRVPVNDGVTGLKR